VDSTISRGHRYRGRYRPCEADIDPHFPGQIDRVWWGARDGQCPTGESLRRVRPLAHRLAGQGYAAV